MRIAYIDKLSLCALAATALSKTRYTDLYYFEGSSGWKRVIGWFVKLKIFPSMPRQVEFRLADIRDDNGESQFVKFTEDTNALCRELGRKEFAGNSFVRSVSRHFDVDKLLLFFEKTIHQEINRKVIYVNTARWHAKRTFDGAAKFSFFMQKDLWSAYLGAYASSREIPAIEYRTMISSHTADCLTRGVFMVAGKIRSAVTSSKIAGMKQPGTVKKSPSDLRSPGGTPIAAWYTGRTVTFGLQQRSDFFWMLKSQIPHDQVLIYFDRTDLPVSDEMANTLKNEHVRFTALSPGARTSSAIPLWRTGPGCTRLFRSLVRAIFTEVALHALKLRRVRWFFISNVLVFAW